MQIKTLHDWALSKCVDVLGLPNDVSSAVVEFAEGKLVEVTLINLASVKIERVKSGAKHLIWMSVLEEVAALYEFDVREFCEAYEHE